MRRTAIALVLALLAGGVAQAAAPRPSMPCSGNARLLTCAVPLPPGVKVRSANVKVLLPADYATSRRRYPVVYLLHGVGDDETAWSNPARGNAAQLTQSCQAIFVMPDGGSGPLAGWYSDWKDGAYQYETFHTQVLPRAVDATFRTTPARAVAGMSMGGFGAMSYAARHPGMFRAVASYSGFVDSTFGAPVTGRFYDVGGQNPAYSLGTPSPRVWGDQTADAPVWAAHNPYDQVEHLEGAVLYVSSGSGAPGGAQGDDPQKAPNYATEAYIRQLNDRFATRLASAGIPFVDARESGGFHDWVYWRAHLTASLKVLMPAVGAASPGCGT